MPTDTSTILGVFQVIPSSRQVRREFRAAAEPRTPPDIAQAVQINGGPHLDPRRAAIFRSWTKRFLSWTISAEDDRIGAPFNERANMSME
jgi:hypothetical protein